MTSTPDLTFESCVTVDVNRWRIEIGVTVTNTRRSTLRRTIKLSAFSHSAYYITIYTILSLARRWYHMRVRRDLYRYNRRVEIHRTSPFALSMAIS